MIRIGPEREDTPEDTPNRSEPTRGVNTVGIDNPVHIVFLLIVLLLVFGAKRLPEMGHSLGTGLRGFKEAIGGESTHTPLSATEQTQAPTPVAVHAPTAQTPAAPLVSIQDDRVA
jgi:sec-independent protein translocase protein TatA